MVKAGLAAALGWLLAVPGTAAPGRTLVIVVDAVPYTLLAELTDPAHGDEALFQGFQPPLPLISTFPSSTSVALVGLLEPLGLPRSPGYEARFFDWDRHRVRGGGPISFFQIEFAWRDFFDWSRKGVVRTALSGIQPIKVSGSRLEAAVEDFLRSDEDPYFVYIETTDTAAHLKGPAALRRVFERLDAALARARERRPDRPFRTVVFSDHGIGGGVPLENVWQPVRERLGRAGYRIRGRLEGPRDVVLTPFGLVSSFEAYTLPEEAAGVAALLIEVEGVDLCVYRAGEEVEVTSDRGTARITRRPGEFESSWSYEPRSGDPLDFGEVLVRLRRRAGDPERTSFPDSWWLGLTSSHFYPDALYRIWRSFELVENPASVLCSLEPDRMFGLKKTEFLASLAEGAVEWTHGALHRDASLGFLLTDDPRWEELARPLRFSEALLPLADPVPPARTAAGRH